MEKVAWIWVVFTLALIIDPRSGLSQEEEEEEVKTYSEDPADADACKVHLDLIYEALQKQKDDRNTWPDWLSDLVPKYLADRHVLTCPFVDRTLDLKTWRQKYFDQVFKDPHASYGYEFCEVPVSFYVWRGVKKTQRDYKLAQMIKLGPERGPFVPLVRCFAHRPVLNLGVNGEIYESDAYWEDKIAPDLHEQMEPASLLAGTVPPLETPKIPARDTNVGPMQIDLSDFYNGALTNDWQGFPGNNLAGLPIGGHDFNGVRFDIRGVVQLSGGIRLPQQFPEKVTGIPIQRKCRAIHFLHATGRSPDQDTITNVVSYEVTYADGRKQRHSLRYFRDILDWWQDPSTAVEETNMRVAWQGSNEASKSYGQIIRLYDYRWKNPRPEVAISHFDFVGTTLTSAPFLVAVTLE